MSLHVAVDATAVPPRLTGAGVYVSRVLRRLATRPDLRVELFANPAAMDELACEGVRRHPVRAAARGRAARIGWTQLRAGRAAAATGATLLHGVHYEVPLAGHLTRVVTVHDLTLLTHPEWHERRKVAYFRWAIRRSLARAARVLCVSAATGADLTRHLGVDPSVIDVTPLGTDLARPPQGQVEALRARLGLARPYLLGLGTLEPRKDLPTLVDAFARVAGELDWDLALAGLDGWGAGAVAEAVGRSGVADRIHRLGFVPEADKAALFSGAEIFVYPSRYEGFGLPVLEAMACGVPTVTTTGGALPEVAGAGALLFEPGDGPGLAAALLTLAGAPAARRQLAGRGVARAAELTWDRCAELTAAAYRRAAGEAAGT